MFDDAQRRIGIGHAARLRTDRLLNPAWMAGMFAEVYGSVIEIRRRY